MNDLFNETLRRHGYSLTKPRQLVFKLLSDNEPWSMKQLAQSAGSKIDRASLYRITRLFEEVGITQRVNLGWKYKIELTDSFSQHHHHITCLGCGLLLTADEDVEVEKLIKKIAEGHGVRPLRHQLEIQGYCQACQSTQATGGPHFL